MAKRAEAGPLWLRRQIRLTVGVSVGAWHRLEVLEDQLNASRPLIVDALLRAVPVAEQVELIKTVIEEDEEAVRAWRAAESPR